MTVQAGAAAHWDAVYALGDDTRSWFENHPVMSLRLLDAARVSAADALIDVGGGASPLTGALLDLGFRDLTVLDVSAAGMQYARDRLGARADRVRWLTADVLSWHPQRRYRAWHDRAVFHFLITKESRQRYLHTLDSATTSGAIAVFGCFAADGPQHCSGLPVARYDAAQLASQIGTKWLLIKQDREEHVTPAGTIQPFTWIALRRQYGLAQTRTDGAPSPPGDGARRRAGQQVSWRPRPWEIPSAGPRPS
jgi:hypothetical protein